MREIAKILLDIKAVVINNQNRFTWASGIKSPIYTDNRLLISHPHEWRIVCMKLQELLVTQYPNANFLAGTATAGIPHATYLAALTDLPMVYVRGEAKSHGKNSQIEGIIPPNAQIVVIEDLLSTGTSSRKVVEHLTQQGHQVLGVLAIFSYQLKQLATNFGKLPYQTLTNLDELLEVAQQRHAITATDVAQIKEFRHNL